MRAAFLDRDGVLIENIPDYVRRIEQIEFFDQAILACQNLVEAGYALVMVTNQSAVGRGVMTQAQVEDINQHVLDRFAHEGAPFLGAYICPHRPEADCDCRKPRPGNLLKAAAEHGIDLASSWMVGDAVSDAQAAIAAGVKPYLVETGRGHVQAQLLPAADLEWVPVFPNLFEVVQYKLKEENS